MRRFLASATAAAFVAAGSFALAPTASAAPGDPIPVFVIHAIPGATVDVYVDATRVADDFNYGDAPLEADLPAGDEVQVRLVPGTNAEGDFTGVLIDETLTVPDVDAISLVAALAPGTAEPSPTLVVFEDSLEPTCEGEAAVVVRHTAAVGPVDVFIDGAVAIEALAFGEEDGGAIPADTDLDVDVALTGEPIENAVISTTINYAAGEVAYLYAVAPSVSSVEIIEVIDTVETEVCAEPTESPTATPTAAPTALPTAVPAGAVPTGSGTGTLWLGAALLALFGALVFGALRRNSSQL
jgi:hypothetical protein